MDPDNLQSRKKKQTKNANPGRNLFEIRRYFSKIAGNSADTAANFFRNHRCAVVVEKFQPKFGLGNAQSTRR